jgi:hypothetical protein
MTIEVFNDCFVVNERQIYRLEDAEQVLTLSIVGSWRSSQADIEPWIYERSESPN